MKPSIHRRIRRRVASREAGIAKKEIASSFFGESTHETFFQPQAAIQRKCDKCEQEEKKLKRMPEKKEEDKNLHRMSDKKEEEKPLQRTADDKKEEDKTLHKKEANGGNSGNTTAGYVNSIGSSGNAMPASLQHFFGSRMQYDFGNIKIHHDARAAESAKDLNAQAYTYGDHIVFANGKYDPASAEGKKLLAHELVHVMQQNQQEPSANLQRKAVDENATEEPELLPMLHVQVSGSQIQNTTHNGNCENVSVSGSTDANYNSSASLSGRPTRATDCSGCTGNDCITVNGTVVSTFTAAPTVTLPAVPGGLNACEQAAVRTFINGTLRQHEQQHVAAFNTYRGTVRTPINFTGCSADLQSEVQNIHDNVEVPRRAASDALSAALDANGANVFTVTCECPDPEPPQTPAPKTSTDATE